MSALVVPVLLRDQVVFFLRHFHSDSQAAVEGAAEAGAVAAAVDPAEREGPAERGVPLERLVQGERAAQLLP